MRVKAFGDFDKPVYKALAWSDGASISCCGLNGPGHSTVEDAAWHGARLAAELAIAQWVHVRVSAPADDERTDESDG